MSFKTIKSVEERANLINTFLKNRKILKQRLLDKKLGEQKLQEAGEKLYQPVTKSVEKAQTATDKKQDKMIEQLKENQTNITQAIDTLSEAVSNQGSNQDVNSWLEKIPSQLDPIEEEAVIEEGEAAVEEESIFKNHEKFVLKKYGFDPSMKTIPDEKLVRKQIQKLVGKRSSKDPIISKTAATEQKILSQYLQTLKTFKLGEKAEIGKAQQKMEESLKIQEAIKAQEAKNAESLESMKAKVEAGKVKKGEGLKINSDHMFGSLYIDPNKLLEMRLEAFKNGKKVISQAIDHSFLELLTKRYNPRRSYSENAQNIFGKMIKLSGISPFTTKSAKIGLGTACNKNKVKYYKTPDELVERLELIFASKNAGNNSIAIMNEAVEIMNTLLNDGLITSDEYKQMYTKFI